VKLSVKSHYAACAVLRLARHFPDSGALKAEDLAAEQSVSPKYLVQILIELKDHGIVRSLRGKDGGYLLAKPPAEITLDDLLHALHEELFDSPALTDPACPPELKRAWQQLQAASKDAARQITFQQLLDEGEEKAKMYYI
jgi:Rrf2 family transcriptional regulator, cysteine metabolism repressor